MPAGRSRRQLAARAAKEACCTSPLDFSRDKRGRLREVVASIVSRIPPSQIFWFSSVQCRTCAMELRRQRATTCKSHAHPFSSNCIAPSRLGGFSGRLAAEISCTIVQVTCGHCLHASAEMRCASYGEMQAGSRVTNRHVLGRVVWRGIRRGHL